MNVQVLKKISPPRIERDRDRYLKVFMFLQDALLIQISRDSDRDREVEDDHTHTRTRQVLFAHLHGRVPDGQPEYNQKHTYNAQ